MLALIRRWPIGRLSAALSLVTVAALLGIFASPSLPPNLGSDPAEAVTVTVRVGDVWFCDPAGPQPCAQPHDTIVAVDDTVVWEWGAGGSGTVVPHTTTNCDGNFLGIAPFCSGALGTEWQSLAVTTGTFSHTFGAGDEGKTFLYLCEIHPTTMRGRIIVQFQTPTAVGGIAEAPELGELPVQTAAPSGGSSALLYALAGAGVAAVAAAVVGAWFSRRRWLG